MINVKLKLAVLGAFSLISAQAMSLGFESLNTVGYAVTGTGAGTHQPTGGTTAFKICNPTGNYGSLSTGASLPTSTTNNTCAFVPNPTTDLTAPEAGFTLVASTNRTVRMDNALTPVGGINVGTLLDVVWRNAANTTCIYGTKVTLTNVDYNPAAGTQRFEVNGIARGGFSGSGDVSVGYSRVSATADVVYRVGRSFTSVQHRAASLGSGTFAPGYYNLPLNSPAYSASINGTNASALTVPTTAEQSADINTNWVEFSTDANFADDDGSTRASSAMTYVKAGCSSAAPATVSNAIRLRQSYQEQGTTQPFIEVRVDGYVPPGGNANPAPVPGSTF